MIGPSACLCRCEDANGQADPVTTDRLVCIAVEDLTSFVRTAGENGLCGIRGAEAAALHFSAVQGTAIVMLPELGVAPPVTQWGAEEIAIESGHHAVYALAVGLIYDHLDRDECRAPSPSTKG